MAHRQSPAEGVRLAQPCINQADDAEKEVSIGSMGILYRSAHRLVILLEDIQLIEMEEVSAPASAGFVEDMSREVNKPGLESRARKYSLSCISDFRNAGLQRKRKTRA